MNAGEIVGGRFRIERLAGSGGMGTVYRAIDAQTGAPVALKVLSAKRLTEPARFHRETAVLRELYHPAIVGYVAHGMTETQLPFLVMEWADGKTLSEVLKDGALGIGASLRVVLGVAGALAAAHRRGVVHRDIKPSNIILEEGDNLAIRVLDFGLARYRTEPETLTQPGIVVGTPGYMAPEQARADGQVDARADIFSLGCVLFECLTGRAPFVAADVVALFAKLVVEEPPRPSSIRPEIPPVIDELLMRMLAKHPGARPAHGEALATEIDNLLAMLDPNLDDAACGTYKPALTQRELRLTTVVLASVEATEPSIERSAEWPGWSLDEALSAVGALCQRLAGGTMLCTLSATGVATDLAARAARCALVLRAYLPNAAIVVATGRCLLSGPVPLGEAIDRAAALLRETQRSPELMPDRSWISIDDLTAGLLDATFDVRGGSAGLFLAGKREPLAIERTLLGRAAPFVGRRRELTFLDAYLNEALEGHFSCAVLVTGPAGAGKSRLLAELLREFLKTNPSVCSWVARADAVGAGSAFSLVAQLLRRAAGIRDGEPIEVRRRKLHARVLRHVPEQDADRIAGFLGELSATWFSSSERLDLRAARQDATLMREEMSRAWSEFIEAECRAQPLMLVLEDLHWGDLPSIKLIGAALKSLSAERLIVLAAARPEVYDVFPALWADASLQELRLAKLSPAASRALANEMLEGKVPDETIDAVVAQAAGNAFYLEELIRTVAQACSATLPSTLVAMTNARLEGLDADARRILRAASVFGDVFCRGGLVQMLGNGGFSSALDRWLHKLVEEELIEPCSENRFPGERDYAFRHALLREAAYATLIPQDRTTAHRAAAAWLEQAGETDPMVLAEHFARGGEPSRAVALYRRAAEKALDGNDLNAAMERARRGIACEARGHELGALRNVQGEVHALRGENAEAEQCGTDVLALVPAGSRSWCWAASTTFTLRLQLGETARAREIVQALVDVAAEPGAELAYVRACAHASALLSHAGMHDVARSFLARAEHIVLPEGQPAHASAGWRWLLRCHVAAFEGDAWTQHGAADNAMQSFSCARSDLGVAISLVQRGTALFSLGRLEDATTDLAAAASNAARLGAQPYVALARAYHGVALARLGHVATGRLLADGAATSFYHQGNPIHFGLSRMLLAEAIGLSGDLEAAEREAGDAALTLDAVPALRWACRGLQGALLLRRGLSDAALSILQQAYAALLSLGSMAEGEAALRLAYAEALLAAGRAEEARGVLLAARERLMHRARAIEDDAVRAVFLENIPEHARTLQLARE